MAVRTIAAALDDAASSQRPRQVIDSHGVAIRAGHYCAIPLHKRLKLVASNRASFALSNAPEEIDRLMAGLAAARKIFRRERGH